MSGHPLNVGVFVDETYDIGRVEDVHFNPWFSNAHPFIEYQLVHGRAFVFGRSDWEYVFNTFAFGYAIGYHFIETDAGEMNGNFLGIGADLAINASVRVDASQPMGVLVTNGEFTAFADEDWLPGSTSWADPTHVVASATNTGAVKFVDSSFWGHGSQVARVDGSGWITFDACEFVEWDMQANAGAGDGRAAIRVFGGSVIVQGSSFEQDKTQIELGPLVKRAVIVGNLFDGAQRWIVNETATNVQAAANAFS